MNSNFNNLLTIPDVPYCSSQITVEPGSCTCSGAHHPKGCMCQNSTDKNCVCNNGGSDHNPSGCLCSGIEGDPKDCLCSGAIGEKNTCTITPCTKTDESFDKGICSCTASNHPLGCKCPKDLAVLSLIPNSICQCLLQDDPRNQCRPIHTISDICIIDSHKTVPQLSCVCSGQSYPHGCRCPEDPTSLDGIPTEICGCIVLRDPRQVCQTESKFDTIVDCTKPTEKTSTYVCPCLTSGDPRYECDIDDPNPRKATSGTQKVAMSVISIAIAVVLPVLIQFQ